MRGIIHKMYFRSDLITPTITADALAALVGPCKSLRKLSFPIPDGWSDIDQDTRAHWWMRPLGDIPSWLFPVSRISTWAPRLLAALARSCPGLQVLRCGNIHDRDLPALAPLSGVLRELDPRNFLCSDESLAAFVGSLSAVTSLRLPRCPSAVLEPIASHLTTLELYDSLYEENNLPGPGFCRLEALTLVLEPESSLFLAPLARLLAANQATLRSLSLTLGDLKADEAPSLVAALRALPRLTHLDLFLRLDITAEDAADPLRITSSSLQVLCATVLSSEPDRCCPTFLQCPRLHTMVMIAPSPANPAWLLAGSPRLRVLSQIRLTRPDLPARLCASGSLVRLEGLHLEAAEFPNPLVLRLPGQLERLDLHIERSARPSRGELPPQPFDMQVEAPGLLDLSLAITDKSLPSARLRLHNCPNLARLKLKSFTSLDEEDVAMMPLRTIISESGLGATSLLGLLARHGTRLRRVTYWCLFEVKLHTIWPELMEALSRLPRLTRLALDVPEAFPQLSFVCPKLRRLHLVGLPGEVKVALSCPLLSRLSGIRDPTRQLVFVLPAPALGAPGFVEEEEEEENEA
ncbi:hypothetical protein PAPYR_496 [Paratrimastix pyriformis]|uniref:Uncharacterized protein n=1 Tax=Paratrimastix pyriformis TaxID=342808 RepID=A0ABQ8UTR0_9EUKA|nr:hypothetical protein PAPYR_496 [Paratrimastix pyriformis]